MVSCVSERCSANYTARNARKRSHTAVRPLSWVGLQRVKPDQSGLICSAWTQSFNQSYHWLSLVSLINQSCKGGSDEVNVIRKQEVDLS